MNLAPQDIILRPRLTEKSVYLRDKRNSYTFEVAPAATKVQVKDAVQRLFSVKVEKVTTHSRPAKFRRGGKTMIMKRRPGKVAVVTLADGQSIEGV